MSRICLFLMFGFVFSCRPCFSQEPPDAVFNDFPAKLMKKESVKEVTQWLVPWDSAQSFLGNSNRLLVGSLEYSAVFDSLGNLSEEGIYISEMKKAKPYHYFKYEYDKESRLVKTNYLFAANKADTLLTRIYKRFYDDQSRLHHDLVYAVDRTGNPTLLPDDSIHYEIDFLGKVSAKIICHAIPGDQSGKRLLEMYSYRYFYNMKGLLSSKTWEDDDTIYQKTKWKYDDNNWCISEEQYFAGATSPSVHKRFEYLQNRKVVQEIINTPGNSAGVSRRQEWFYDENGKVLACVEKTGEEGEPICLVYRYTYY